MVVHKTLNTQLITLLSIQHQIILQQCGTHTQTNLSKLEKINTAAAMFCVNNCTKTPGISIRIKQLHMDALSILRQAHRLTVMYRITNNQININKQEYLHHTNTPNTHTHNQKYVTYCNNTDSFKQSKLHQCISDPTHKTLRPTSCAPLTVADKVTLIHVFQAVWWG